MNRKLINVEIGQNVKRARENAGLTQEGMAELLGIGVKHVSAIECGAVGVSLTTLRSICSLLSISADSILFGTPTDIDYDRSAVLAVMNGRIARLSDKQFFMFKDIVDKLLIAMIK